MFNVLTVPNPGSEKNRTVPVTRMGVPLIYYWFRADPGEE